MNDLIFNYNLLLNSIDKMYTGNKIENKINLFCKDIRVKVYRFKKILESKAYFQCDEMYRIIKKLDIKFNEIEDYFFKVM